VCAGYIKQIPKDPMTNEANWEPHQEDILLSVDQQDPGIDDVHSASNATRRTARRIQQLVGIGRARFHRPVK